MRAPRLREVVAVFVFAIFAILAAFLYLLNQANRTIARQNAATAALATQVSELSACIVDGDTGSERCRNLAAEPPVIRVESGGSTRIIVPPGSANSSSRSTSGSSSTASPSPSRSPRPRPTSSPPRSTPAPTARPQCVRDVCLPALP